jgi:hypothetical protein
MLYTAIQVARNPAWSDWGAEELLEVEQELEKLGQTAGVATRFPRPREGGSWEGPGGSWRVLRSPGGDQNLEIPETF